MMDEKLPVPVYMLCNKHMNAYLAIGNKSNKQTPKNTPPEKHDNIERKRFANFSFEDLIARCISTYLYI